GEAAVNGWIEAYRSAQARKPDPVTHAAGGGLGSACVSSDGVSSRRAGGGQVAQMRPAPPFAAEAASGSVLAPLGLLSAGGGAAVFFWGVRARRGRAAAAGKENRRVRVRRADVGQIVDPMREELVTTGASPWGD